MDDSVVFHEGQIVLKGKIQYVKKHLISMERSWMRCTRCEDSIGKKSKSLALGIHFPLSKTSVGKSEGIFVRYI